MGLYHMSELGLLGAKLLEIRTWDLFIHFFKIPLTLSTVMGTR